MSPRPYWKGYLKLSLVSCPIAVHAACSSAERVSFRQINRKTGNRLRQQLIDEETREVVEAHEKARGYEIGKAQYLLIEDDELEAIEIASTHTIDIDSFVPRAEIDQRFFDAPYYITPDDPVGQDAFAVIREAMRAEKVVGLARAVLFRRERVLKLQPHGRGIVATSLRFANEVHAADGYFTEISDLELPKEMLELAKHIIHKMAGRFEPDRFEDRYEIALIELIRSKQKGMPVKARPEHRQTNVIDLMDALRRSVETERRSVSKPSAPKPESGKAASKPAEGKPIKTARKGKARIGKAG